MLTTVSQAVPKRFSTASLTQPLTQRIILLFVLGYEGLGGIAGGALLVAKPDGQLMEMPVKIMHGTFPDFLVPGIILLCMGVLSLFAFFTTLKRKKNDWLISSITLSGWIIWFVTEIIILQELHWLHIMWGLPVLVGAVAAMYLVVQKKVTVQLQKAMLYCGIFSSLWYVFINLYVPMQYDGYSMKSFTVSELSAIGAPTRVLWVLLVLIYPLAFAFFGLGVKQSSGSNSRLRTIGNLMIAYSVFNFFWPPMHMRGQEPGLTDTLHITWAFVTVLMMITMMGFGMAAFGKSFRIYTIVSLAVLLIFGVLTGTESPNIPVNGPTPMIGIWERINIGVFMLWIIVLAHNLLEEQNKVRSLMNQ